MIKPITTQTEINGMGYVLYKSWQETYTGLIDSSYLSTMSLEKCEKIASFQKDNSLVAVEDGNVVGFVGFGAYRDEKDTNMGEIYGLYILEEYHGKKIGYNLMNEAVGRLYDYKKIALWVLKGNDKAIRFYERYGFKFDGIEKKVSLGTEQTELRMVLEKEHHMKAIITDLDRTLLHTDKSVSEYTISVLKKCRGQGMLVMAASARPLRDVLIFKDILGFDAITATNGAVVLLADKKLEFGISRESGERILSDILKFPDVCLSVETSNGLYANRDIPVWEPIVYDKFPTLPENIILYKILASSDEKPLYDNVETVLTNDVYHTISENSLVQIMSNAATKWNGINHMLSHFGVSPKDAVYFGDDNDDIEPIKNCGLGVAVSNAIPAVLDVADKITDSNDMDGVAKFIEEHFLHERTAQ